MRPWLPVIRYSDLITRAPASDRGCIRRQSFAGFAITLFEFAKLLAQYRRSPLDGRAEFSVA